jgi:hypothetical protein
MLQPFLILFLIPFSILKMNIAELRASNLILFECIAGSQSYNLHTPQSDLDIRGVFVLPETDYYGLNYIEQVHDEKNDIVFYELRRFVQLSYNNNPNILEMLAMPECCILYKHPAFDYLKIEDFLSKRCKETFAGYARSQISKAHGLNKKIMTPMDKVRKTLLDFCYIVEGYGSIAINEWLMAQGFEQQNCGLVHIPHTKNVYAVFHDATGTEGYEGIIKKNFSNEVSTSSTRKGVLPEATLFCNIEGYSLYCKQYKEYWEWVEKRSEVRYENTVAHGKNYDAKNMMHTFRLLDMALEIVRDGKIIVERQNRDYLLKIKMGEFMYDELLEIAEAKMQDIETAFATCTLPMQPDFEAIQASLVAIRRTIYRAQ